LSLDGIEKSYPLFVAIPFNEAYWNI